MYLVKGIPNTSFVRTIDGDKISVIPNVYNVSDSEVFSTNVVDFDFATPEEDTFIIIKGISVYGEGNSGTVEIKSSGEVVSKMTFTSSDKRFILDNINYKLEDNANISVTITGRSSVETFVGITYINVTTSQQIVILYDLFLDSDGEPLSLSDDNFFYVLR